MQKFTRRGQLRLLSGQKIQSPIGLGTRPTCSIVREALINIIGNNFNGCSWLELFCGSGVMSCEALQRGAQVVVAVDRNRKTAAICKSNLTPLKSSINYPAVVEVISKDVISWLKKRSSTNSDLSANQNPYKIYPQFDYVFLDPPYDSNLYTSTLQELLKGKWITKNSLVICEYSSTRTIAPPSSWVEEDRRIYGQSSLLFITPPKEYSSDTDSKQPRRGQAK